MSNVTVSRSATVVHTPVNPYISRVYEFIPISDVFSGSIQIDYEDAELNGIPRQPLHLIFTMAPTGQHTLPAPMMTSIILFSPPALVALP
jgi:hypothetical protein